MQWTIAPPTHRRGNRISFFSKKESLVMFCFLFWNVEIEFQTKKVDCSFFGVPLPAVIGYRKRICCLLVLGAMDPGTTKTREQQRRQYMNCCSCQRVEQVD